MNITLYPALIAGLVLTLFGVLGVNAMAQEPDTKPATELSTAQAPVLKVDPIRCVLKAGQDLCRIQLTLSWQADKAHSVCLTEKDDELVLACWDDAVRGATRLLFVGEDNVTYVLSTDSDDVVSEVTLSVGRVSKPKRRSNKRRRRYWGFP